MRIADQKITVYGALTDHEGGDLHAAVLQLDLLAAPKFIWIKVVAWDMLDTSRTLMKTANDLCRSGDPIRAREHYEQVYADSLEHGILGGGLPHSVYESDAAPPTILAMHSYADAAAAAGLLHLRELKIEKAQKAEDYTHGLSAYISQFDNKNGVLGYETEERATWLLAAPFWHLRLLLALAKGVFGLDLFQAKFEAAHALQPGNEYIAHDLRLVDRTNNLYKERQPFVNTQTGTVPNLDSMLKESSVIALPPQAFLFDIPQHVERPARVYGWVDGDQHEAACKTYPS